jgi:hypothetical protein
MANVGDTVAYVPEIDQALHPDAAGNLPWSWRYVKDGSPVPAGTKIQRFAHQTSHVDPRNHPVEPDKPCTLWEARITALNQDGTAALEIGHPRGSWLLHYPKVRQSSPEDPQPGTWFERQGE